jgi:hypothetical protein
MVGASGVAHGTAVLIRTKPSLMRSGTLAIAIGALPFFGVLYWLSLSQGSWRRVVAANAVFVAVWFVAWYRFRRVHVRVDSELITKQSFVSRTVVQRADVATIVIAETYRHSSPDTIPQLLALDRAGQRLFRLRGWFWTRDDMVTLAAAIGVDPIIEADPVSRPEFYELHPGITYWYENRPWLKTLGIVLALVIAAFLVAWLMTAVGTPGMFTLAV